MDIVDVVVTTGLDVFIDLIDLSVLNDSLIWIGLVMIDLIDFIDLTILIDFLCFFNQMQGLMGSLGIEYDIEIAVSVVIKNTPGELCMVQGKGLLPTLLAHAVS